MKKILKIKYMIFIIVLFSIFSLGIVYSALNQELEIAGTSTVSAVIPTANLVFDHTSTFTNQGANRDYSIDVTITNIGDANSYSWTFNMPVPNDVSNLSCWGMICTLEGTNLRIQNQTWNGIIVPGGNTTGGITFRTKNGDYVPEDPIIEEPEEANLGENVVVTPTITNTWGNGANRTFQMNVNVTNNNDVAILWWRADFLKNTYDFTVSSVWNATYIDSATSLRVSNETYNGTIEPGQTVSFGMQLVHRNPNFNIVASNIQAGR